MSLFKTREFWNTQCGHNEEFDQFSIHVCNIDNSPDGSDKIIVGSHSGILRIYGLRATKLSTDQIDINELGYDENDVLVEMQFPFPILQVQSGILLSASDKRQLLVLFPRKLSVFSVTSSEGLSEYGFSYSITPLYEHELQRSAFCLTVGSFGQVKGRDFVCVQSLDCCLMFFEQETSSFWLRTVTTNSLLPTSFAYLSMNDTFLIQSADWTLQCFRYQMLAISAHQDEKNGKNLRKVIPDWSFELGEQALQIETNGSLIIVLGERNLFVLRSDSTMYYQKKLGDFKPICCHSYFKNKGQTNADSTGSKTTKNVSTAKTSSSSIKHTAGQQDHKQSVLESNLVVLLITEMSTLLIYNDRQLKWACQLQMLYCQVLRSSFYFSPNSELVGCLAFLSPSGHLSIAFLGTNPSVDIVNNVKSSLTNRRSVATTSMQAGKQQSKKTRSLSAEDKEELFTNTQMEKEEFDRELGELRKIINAYNSDFSTLIKLNNTNQDGTSQLDVDDLSVEIINFKFDALNDGLNRSNKLDKQQTNAIDLELNLESNKELSNLVISLSASSCFNIKPNLHNIIKLDSSIKDSSSSFQFRLFYDPFSRLLSFRSNKIYLVINYFNEKNLPRVYTKPIELPLNLFLKLRNKTGFNQNSRASSSTNTSQTSSASQRSLKANQTIDQASLDQFLQESTLTNQTRTTISFQFFAKRSNFNLSELMQEICSHTNLNKLIKKSADDSLAISNKITIQFINSKLKLVHVEFSYDDETKMNETNEKISGNRCLVDIIGDDLHSNSFIFNLLVTKLYQLYLNKSIDKILFNRSSLPMKEYFQLIDQHLNLRQQMKSKKDLLEEHCERLRVIEKRILIKLKDRNISNLNNLESLLNVQHKKITSLANQLLDLEQGFDDESIRLNCVNQLFCSVLKIVGCLNEEESSLLEGSLNVLPFVQANDLESWQEVTETSLNFLLKNHLKDNVEVSRMSNGQFFQPENCESLFRLLKLTVEKVFQGNLFQSRFTGLSSGNLDRQAILEVDEEYTN